jgi:hypothetical protein
MPLTEIEFDLPAYQYELMGYPGLKQGEALTLVLDGGVLLPDPASDAWFEVQKEPLPTRFEQVAPATYAFAGQIKQAELNKEGGSETANLLVQCGKIALRVTCAPQADGRLPWGTWETRHLTGYTRLYGIVEDDFASAIGQPLGITIWGFKRLVLTPGDPVFGQWRATTELPPTPYVYDRILITGRLHGTSETS